MKNQQDSILLQQNSSQEYNLPSPNTLTTKLEKEQMHKIELQSLEIEDLKFQIQNLKRMNDSLNKAYGNQPKEEQPFKTIIQSELERIGQQHQAEVKEIKQHNQEQIQREKDKIKEMKKKINQTSQQHQKEIEKLESIINSYKIQIDQFESWKKHAYSDQLKQEIMLHKQEQEAQIKRNQEDYEQKLYKIQQQHTIMASDIKNEYEKQILQQQNQIESLKIKLQELSFSNQNETVYSAKLDALYKEKDEQLVTIQQQNGELQTKIKQQQQHITELQNQLQELSESKQQEVKNLKQKLQKAKEVLDRTEQLQTEYQKQTQLNQKYKQKIQQYIDNEIQLNKEIEDLKHQLDNLEIEYEQRLKQEKMRIAMLQKNMEEDRSLSPNSSSTKQLNQEIHQKDLMIQKLKQKNEELSKKLLQMSYNFPKQMPQQNNQKPLSSRDISPAQSQPPKKHSSKSPRIKTEMYNKTENQQINLDDSVSQSLSYSDLQISQKNKS